MQEMVYLKAIQRSAPMGVCREPPIKKRIWKNLGGFSPPPWIRLWTLPPFPPGYSPGRNSILIAGYRPSRLEFVIVRSLCAHPFGNSN